MEQTADPRWRFFIWTLYFLCWCRSLECTEQCTQATQGGTAQGAECVFPFFYDGTEYHNCTTTNHNRPWCATSQNYETDNLWGNCIYDCEIAECPVMTTEGSPCVFPFIYKGSPYFQCTNATRPDGTSIEWCATTDNWDRDQLAADCIVLTTLDNRPCAFPFQYRDTTYYSCTTEHSTTGRLWCGVQAFVDDNEGSDYDWGYCVLDGMCETTISPSVSPLSTEANLPPTVSGNDTSVAAIVVPVIIVIILVTGIIVLVIILRRRKRPERSQEPNVPEYFYPEHSTGEQLKPTENLSVDQHYKAKPTENSYENKSYMPDRVDTDNARYNIYVNKENGIENPHYSG